MKGSINMKKLAVLLAVFCLLVLGCAQAAEYEPLHFSLWADTDAGYEWTCEYDDNGVLAEPMEEIIQQESGSTFDYYFALEKAGDAEIIFNYGMAWDLSAPVMTSVCSISALQDGQVLVSKAETFTDDRMIVVTLPCNPSTGASWSYQGESEVGGMVSLVEEYYEPYDAHLDGAGGNMIYHLRVDKPGETVLLFNHGNLWDPTAAAQQSYAVVVYASDDNELSISVER